MSNDETTAEDNKCKNNLIGMKKNEVVLCRRNSQIVIHYPIGEDLLKEECRWKFLEWYPRCYLPCSINSYYTHPRSCQRKMQSSKVANSSYNAVTISSDDSVMDSIMLDDLPEHIHIQIMQYIHPTERFINVSLVSKYWYKVVNRGIFWREICIHLSWSQTVSKSLQIFLRKAQMHVEKMCINTFEENPFPDKLFISLFPPEMKRMKVLDIGFHPMLSQSLVEFFSKCFPNLQELNVEGTKAFGSHVYSTLLSKGFPNLRKILISNCSLLSAEDYRQFCRVSRPIEVLSVDGTTSLGNFSAMYLEKSPFALTLTRLYLDGEDMDDFGFQALTACKNLNLLSISFCENLTDASLDFVKTFPNLGHLHLRKGRKFTFDGLMKLFMLCNNETVMFPVMLRFLDLSECPAVDDRVVDQLTSSCPKLQSLNLAWNWSISNVGFTQIIKRLKQIQFLDLMGIYSITSSTIMNLPDCYFSKLRFLSIVQCPQFDEMSLWWLQLKRKKLIIINYSSFYNVLTLHGNELIFSERCDWKYKYAVFDLMRECEGYCCMSVIF